MHNVTVLDQKWWLGAYWLSGNKLLGSGPWQGLREEGQGNGWRNWLKEPAEGSG